MIAGQNVNVMREGKKRRNKREVWITYEVVYRGTIQFPVHKAFTSQKKAIKHTKECPDCNTFQGLELE